MKHSLYIGKIAGVRIYVHWTFALLIAWIVFSGLRQHLGSTEILWVLGLMTAVFTCIVLHELGHALVARRFSGSSANGCNPGKSKA
jgi:Zn-dependent protease